MRLDDAAPADAGAVLALNNSAVPAVNALDAAELERIIALTSYYRVARDAEGIVGVVICMAHDAAYWSGNFHWFRERYAEFLYLDRVIVAERARGRGVGALLYEDMHRFAATRWPRVTLEVNLRPPNPGSDRFHQRLGYTPVGIREYADRDYAVTMYARELRR